MDSFFKVKSPAEVFQIIKQFEAFGIETVPLKDALDRVPDRDITADENLPHFFRSVVDGYAVKARDTFGASESLPALLEVVGEVIMGRGAGPAVGDGQAVKISTGGMLPENSDSVVMVEHCHFLDEYTLEVLRTVSPLENTIQPGDDVRQGETILQRGKPLRPQDLGLLAGLGIANVSVCNKPRVAVISTGDEIISIHEKPQPGQVRDINAYTLGAFCRRMGAEPVSMKRTDDDFEILKTRVYEGLNQAETVWISGGSSVGTRDLTLKVFETLPDFELLVHGISISPGKPTIIGRCGKKPVIGLPGHVASALVVAEVFLGPLIGRLSGRTALPEKWPRIQVEAVLARNIESANGREDYVRVKLIETEDGLIAEPVFGKSGLISTLVQADGLLRIDMNTEGLYKDQTVHVMLSGGLS